MCAMPVLISAHMHSVAENVVVHMYTVHLHLTSILFTRAQWLVSHREALADTQIAFGIRLQVLAYIVHAYWHVHAFTCA
jgi:hypothetical protein